MLSKLLRSSAVAALCLGSLSGQFVSAQQQFVAPVPIKITNSAAFPPAGPVIAVADFNGDGRKDILTGGSGTLLANSDGSYTAISSGKNIGGSQVADINGDGRLDLINISPSGGNSHGFPTDISTLSIALGNGDGTFTAQPDVNLGENFTNLDLVVDLNKDGKADIISDSKDCLFGDPSNTDDCQGSSTPSLQVMLADGGGQGLGPGSRLLTTGDFKGDGYPDLVLQTNSGVQVAINNKGTFTYGTPYLFGARLAAVGDLNHDGKLDLVLVGQPVGSNVEIGQILLGNGDSTFRVGGTFAPSLAAGTVTSVFVGDVNGNGLQDIALTAGFSPYTNGPVSDANLQIFAGNGNGTVAFPIVFNLGDAIHEGLFDLKNDGKPELLTFGSAGFAVTGNAGTGFLRAPRITTVYSPNSIVKVDFNKDSKEDVAVVSNAVSSSGHGTVVVLPGSGKGYFNAAKSYVIGMASGIVTVGDVNRDGILDLVVARSAAYDKAHPYYGSRTTDLSVLLGNGDGTLKPAMNFTVLGKPIKGYSDNFAALADVNHDGKLDLIGDWGVALGNGDGTFAAPIPLPASLQNIGVIAGGDFNHDGVLDLAVTSTTTLNAGVGIVSTLIGDGKGGYTVNGQQQLPRARGVEGLAVADIDGDGKPDLIFGDGYFSTATQNDAIALVVRLGNGDGTFAAPIIHPLGSVPASSAQPQFLVGDFNRDGKQDLLILAGFTEPGQRLAGGNITLYFGLGGGKLTTTPQYFQTSLDQGVVLNLDAGGGLDVAGTTPAGVTRLINTGSRAIVTK